MSLEILIIFYALVCGHPASRGAARGAEVAAAPPPTKREEREGRGREKERRKRKRGIKRERKLNQSF